MSARIYTNKISSLELLKPSHLQISATPYPQLLEKKLIRFEKSISKERSISNKKYESKNKNISSKKVSRSKTFIGNQENVEMNSQYQDSLFKDVRERKVQDLKFESQNFSIVNLEEILKKYENLDSITSNFINIQKYKELKDPLKEILLTIIRYSVLLK